MVENLDRQIVELQRDTRHRQAITVAVVIGIFAGIACGLLLPLQYPWLVPSVRSPQMMICFLALFAVCVGLGHAVYRILRWLRH